MPELRKDHIIGRWVIIASERGKRPCDFKNIPESQSQAFCPFCNGNEAMTPPEVLAYRHAGTKPNEAGWWVRVVSNKFPALSPDGDVVRTGEGMYDMMNGVGAHEVIIETPDHDASYATYEQSQIEEILWSFRDRMMDLRRDRRFRYILLFKNHGREAGASLEHPHSQLIATPTVPKRVQEEVSGALNYYRFKERCVYCDIVKQELDTESRVVAENDSFVAFEPFASRFPFETWVVPRAHEAHFENIQKHHIMDMAKVMHTVFSRIKEVLNDPPYNFIIHTSPCNEPDLAHYHWHIEIMPKLTKVAGFEWGTGFYINPTPPEQAAAWLRGELADEIPQIPGANIPPKKQAV
ncbi:MAG TPA: galactose-1-phosphate uridylyltransferase [bacterium]|nr:galactose-1-phosphate uridylyltransferase [bacterium]